MLSTARGPSLKRSPSGYVVVGRTQTLAPRRSGMALNRSHTARPYTRFLGHTADYKARRLREFLRAVESNDTRAAESVVRATRDDTPTERARFERGCKIARERGQTWAEMAQERSRDRVTAMLDAREYLGVRFRAEAHDEDVRSLDDFLSLVTGKQAIKLAPRNVAIVAEAMIPPRAVHMDDYIDDARISKQAMADALNVTPKTIQNWVAWYRPQRFST